MPNLYDRRVKTKKAPPSLSPALEARKRTGCLLLYAGLGHLIPPPPVRSSLFSWPTLTLVCRYPAVISFHSTIQLSPLRDRRLSPPSPISFVNISLYFSSPRLIPATVGPAVVSFQERHQSSRQQLRVLRPLCRGYPVVTVAVVRIVSGQQHLGANRNSRRNSSGQRAPGRIGMGEGNRNGNENSGR